MKTIPIVVSANSTQVYTLLHSKITRTIFFSLTLKLFTGNQCTMNERQFNIGDLHGTARLGDAIGANLKPGDLVYLDGDLGAGKTTLTKSVAAALGFSTTSVTSPTFTLVHEYVGGRMPLYHFDFYRLTSPSELEGLGFDDYLSADDGALIIEWSKKATGRLPEDAVSVLILRNVDGGEAREINLSSGGERSDELIEDIMSTLNC
jgi:tRNA threonylcarbamoyladenosine biosynthesis protein TsaE